MKMKSEHQHSHDPHSRDLAQLRVDYAARALSELEVDPDPIRQFILWLDQAIAVRAHEPNAMTLATTDGTRPSARVVLLKHIDGDGLVFFTNYHSRKAAQLDSNPHAAAVFWWPELHRQVRVEGTISRTTRERSEDYFNRRPPESRLSAAASPQSRIVPSREALEQRVAELAEQYPDGNVPCPANWGGYCLRPQTIEFWQGRQGRLHDRIEYSWNEANGWIIRRLAP
jgi:pyridoxamine 5'-phosphate oxidase